MSAKTQVILKKDCNFSIIGHPRLYGTTNMWKAIKMNYENKSYFMFHSLIAFRRNDEVFSFSQPRKFGNCEAQRVINALPNKIEIFV